MFSDLSNFFRLINPLFWFSGNTIQCFANKIHYRKTFKSRGTAGQPESSKFRWPLLSKGVSARFNSHWSLPWGMERIYKWKLTVETDNWQDSENSLMKLTTDKIVEAVANWPQTSLKSRRSTRPIVFQISAKEPFLLIKKLRIDSIFSDDASCWSIGKSGNG